MASTRDFLLEIGCEEMPSAPLMKAQAQLETLIGKGLDAAGLAHGKVSTLSSPRRLAVMVEGVAEATEEVHEVMRGPKVAIAFDADGAPTRAAQGFARKCGVTPEELVVRREKDGCDYVFSERTIASVAATELLGTLAERTIADITWPNYRSQRWGSEHATFVRPIRWIVCLLGDEPVSVRYADVVSSNVTRGHRVLAPGDHEVPSAADYEQVLEGACVLGERRRAELIRDEIARIEAERGGAHVDAPKATFDEVVNLCEWPSVIVGTFDEEFLSVPHEIICEAMLKHQRYFPIYAADGSLTREFVIVSNADPAVADVVRLGNERVVRPRLDDAKFFYEEDLKVGLTNFRERLADVVFQKRLGTVLDKSRRMEALAAEFCRQATGLEADVADAARAAHLAKADLVSQAVVEFTSQQGIMGGYYAKAQGEHDRVCRAIAEHYRPRFAGDEIPSDLIGQAVAAADKLDTICGMFAIQEPPTGSSDPYAVRRSAIGVIAILKEQPEVSLRALVRCALDNLAEQGIDFDARKVASDVASFFQGRLKAMAREEGISPDTIDAVAATGVIDPAWFDARAHALEDARALRREVFDDLATAYARASHLADPALGSEVVTDILEAPERALLSALETGEQIVKKALSLHDFAGACDALADLREPIDNFFDDVLVMEEDTSIRENRLRLLNRFTNVFADVADIGALSRRK